MSDTKKVKIADFEVSAVEYLTTDGRKVGIIGSGVNLSDAGPEAFKEALERVPYYEKALSVVATGNFVVLPVGYEVTYDLEAYLEIPWLTPAWIGAFSLPKQE